MPTKVATSEFVIQPRAIILRMDFLKNFEWTPMNVLKAAGLFLVALIVLSVAYNLFLRPTVETVMRDAGNFAVSQGIAPSAYSGGYGGGYYADEDYLYAEKAGYGGMTEGPMSPTLSLDNIGIPMPPPSPSGTVGGDAEEFEVTDYSVSIETRDRDDTCTEIAELKKLEYVVFESANEHERGCNYTFKVEHKRVDEVLAILETFDPKELSENTHTIKRQLDDFTSETEILKKKLGAIDETLKSALDAYGEITALATRTQNAEALAKIIDSRINIIERLTQERINVTAQLERLERGKAEQLDKLEYTYFYVNIYENKFVDGKNLADEWKNALRATVNEVNTTLQEVTLGLVALLFLLAQWLLYAFILLIVAKYGWKVVKYLWQK